MPASKLFVSDLHIPGVAHWILNTVGQPALDGVSKKPVLAYIGDSDLRYYVVPLAMVKVGYVVSLYSKWVQLPPRWYLIVF